MPMIMLILANYAEIMLLLFTSTLGTSAIPVLLTYAIPVLYQLS